MCTIISNTDNIVVKDIFTTQELKELIKECNYEPFYDEYSSPELIQFAAYVDTNGSVSCTQNANKSQNTNENLKANKNLKTNENLKMAGFISCIVPEFLYNDNAVSDINEDDNNNEFEIEITAMISPQYRKMGLFTKLLGILKEEISNRCSNAGILLPSITYLTSNERKQSGYYNESPQLNYVYSDYLMTLSKSKANSNSHKCSKPNDTTHYEITNNDEEFLLIDTSLDIIISSTAYSVYEKSICFYDVWTNPDYRQKGYARYLLTYTINSFLNDKNLSIDSFMLHVSSRNTAAVKLYNSLGFTIGQEIKQYKLA